MRLVPTPAEIIELLRQSGALREGHFECLNGLHTDTYLDMALALRCPTHQRMLSVALSRLLREQTEIRVVRPQLSIVAVAAAALPIAWGLCEALRAEQVYWVERPSPDAPLRLRQFFEQNPGERVVLVDDVLRAGRLVAEARGLFEGFGAEVVAVAAVAHQPAPDAADLGALPVYTLARLESTYYAAPPACELCRKGMPLIRRERAARAIGA